MTGHLNRVLLIGGTGVFGERLARHLAGGFDLVVSSRSRAKVETLASEIGSRAVDLDTGTNLRERLAELKPWAVVDCSGPFQRADHGTARACLEAGAHAIDLADARHYLLGYAAALDGVAKRNGVRGIAGASSTPALSGAVARELTQGWTHVDALDFAIVPGGAGAVGRSVLEAVVSYAGRLVPVWREGRSATVAGWADGVAIEVPGLGRRRVAPVETADAELLGQALAVRDRVTFRAGLETWPEQRGLEWLARLCRRTGWSPGALVPWLHRARALTRPFASDTGGMVVRAEGADAQGMPTGATWTLIARGGDGPQVPILAAAAALRRLTQGVAPGAGVAELPLGAIMAEAKRYRIETRLERMPVVAVRTAA